MSRHLAKLFDSLCKLKFRLDADEKPLKLGLGMFSKEDEYVDFDQECDLSGQVSAGGTSRADRSPPPPRPPSWDCPSLQQALQQLPQRISSAA